MPCHQEAESTSSCPYNYISMRISALGGLNTWEGGTVGHVLVLQVDDWRLVMISPRPPERTESRWLQHTQVAGAPNCEIQNPFALTWPFRSQLSTNTVVCFAQSTISPAEQAAIERRVIRFPGIFFSESSLPENPLELIWAYATAGIESGLTIGSGRETCERGDVFGLWPDLLCVCALVNQVLFTCWRAAVQAWYGVGVLCTWSPLHTSLKGSIAALSA
ncbi:hypothetical protein V8C26DRAFT_126810 [Trichoderma gracile]